MVQKYKMGVTFNNMDTIRRIIRLKLWSLATAETKQLVCQLCAVVMESDVV